MTQESGSCHGGTCESCGMPVESGPYCQYCQDADGNLQTFVERLARLSQWLRHETPELSDRQARSMALDAMSSMPAWSGHPEILEHMKFRDSHHEAP